MLLFFLLPLCLAQKQYLVRTNDGQASIVKTGQTIFGDTGVQNLKETLFDFSIVQPRSGPSEPLRWDYIIKHAKQEEGDEETKEWNYFVQHGDDDGDDQEILMASEDSKPENSELSTANKYVSSSSGSDRKEGDIPSKSRRWDIHKFKLKK